MGCGNLKTKLKALITLQDFLNSLLTMKLSSIMNTKEFIRLKSILLIQML